MNEFRILILKMSTSSIVISILVMLFLGTYGDMTIDISISTMTAILIAVLCNVILSMIVVHVLVSFDADESNAITRYNNIIAMCWLSTQSVFMAYIMSWIKDYHISIDDIMMLILSIALLETIARMIRMSRERYNT